MRYIDVRTTATAHDVAVTARNGILTIISAIFFKVRTLCFCLSPFSSGGFSMYFFENILTGLSRHKVGNKGEQNEAQ